MAGEELALSLREYSVRLIVETACGEYAHDFRPQDLVQHVTNLAAEHFQIVLPGGRLAVAQGRAVAESERDDPRSWAP